MDIPRGLDWWRDVPGGAAWLVRLPRLAGECAEQWQLRIGPAFEGQLLEEWLADMKRRRRASGTLTTYRFILTPFIEWAGAQGQSVLDFRRVDVETYLREYDLTFEAKWGRPPEPSTVRNVIVAVTQPPEDRPAPEKSRIAVPDVRAAKSD